MKSFSKEERKMLRKLATLAYEREVESLLVDLDAVFFRWRAGGIESVELYQRIHQFDRGPARELFTLYNGLHADLLVARAISRGILHDEDVTRDLREKLSAQVAFFDRQTEYALGKG